MPFRDSALSRRRCDDADVISPLVCFGIADSSARSASEGQNDEEGGVGVCRAGEAGEPAFASQSRPQRVLRTRQSEHWVLRRWLAEACAIFIGRGLSPGIVDGKRPVPQAEHGKRTVVDSLGKIGDGNDHAEENRSARVRVVRVAVGRL